MINPKNHKKAWSEKDDNTLIYHWGHTQVGLIARELGRTDIGVIRRARKLKLGPQLTDFKTVKDVCEITGYGHTTVLTIIQNLRIKPRRLKVSAAKKEENKRKGRKYFTLSEGAVEKIVEYCKTLDGVTEVKRSNKGKWRETGLKLSKPRACLACGSASRPHWARGLCTKCYASAYYKGTLTEYPRCQTRTLPRIFLKVGTPVKVCRPKRYQKNSLQWSSEHKKFEGVEAKVSRRILRKNGYVYKLKGIESTLFLGHWLEKLDDNREQRANG